MTDAGTDVGSGGVYEIVMAHAAKNALSTELMAWLEGELDRAGERAILLTGTADAFSAGLNLKEVTALESSSLEAFVRRIDALCVRLFEHPAPVVAWVNGHAIAGGCVLMMCCDWRVATANPRTRIGLNEVAIGACFPPAIFNILAHRLPPQHVERVLLGAELFDTREALRLGLVDEIDESGDGTLARSRLAMLAAHPRGAYLRTRAKLRRDVTQVSERDARELASEELPIWSSAHTRQRMRDVLRR